MSCRFSLTCAGLVAALVAACGNGAAPTPVTARSYDDPGVVVAGNHELRYGAVLSADLSPEVAASYGIDRRGDQMVVNLSVLRRVPGQLPAAVDATVSGTWHDLIGEPARLRFRTVTAGGAVSYIAIAAVRDRQPIVLELQAQPAGSDLLLTTTITRQFELR